MRRNVVILLAVLAVVAGSAFTGATPTSKACHTCDAPRLSPLQTPAPQASSPIVHAVLFYSTGCGHCVKVLTQTLPAMDARYGDRFQVTLVSLEDQSAVDRLYATAEELGLAKESVAIPFMVIGRTVLIGSQEIPDQLPGLIEAGLASGGIPLPSLRSLEGLGAGPSLESLLTPAPSPSPLPPLVAAEASQPRPTGFGLAWAVMVLLVAAALFSIYGFVGGPIPPMGSIRDGRSWLIPALIMLGLIIAAYMSYVEIARVNAVCGPIGDCNAVQTSRYAKLFGVVPMALFGLAGYLAILAGWTWRRIRNDALARVAPLLVFAATLFGVLFSVYLTYIEIFVLRAVCAWCLGNATVMALLLFVTTPSALGALEPEVPEEDAH